MAARRLDDGGTVNGAKVRVVDDDVAAAGQGVLDQGGLTARGVAMVDEVVSTDVGMGGRQTLPVERALPGAGQADEDDHFHDDGDARGEACGSGVSGRRGRGGFASSRIPWRS